MGTMTPDFISREKRGISMRDVIFIISLAVAWGALQAEVSAIKEDVQFIKGALIQKGLK